MATSDELKAQLEQLLATVEEAKVALTPFQNKELELNAQKHALQQSYHEQMETIKRTQRELDEQKFKYQSIVNNASWEADKLKIAAEKAAQAEAAAIKELHAAQELAELNLALTARFDKVTMTLPWREWAKDHQISAGHKMVMDKNVILADHMGLGKTLSAIITCDMAERATKDASPETPFLGEEKEVYVSPQLVEAVTDEPIKGYVAYDKKQKMLNEGLWINKPGFYENRIVNGIERPVGRRILYICPSSLLKNVMAEWQMWSPHRNVTYIGGMSKAERNFVIEKTLPMLADYVIIVNYEAWRKEKALIDKLIACDFDTVIIDEAHNAKDPKTSVNTGIKRILREKRPEYVIPMTGTPILNRPEELFELLHMVNPKEFYRLNDFLYNYCEQKEFDDGKVKWVFPTGGLDRIVKRINKNFLRRTKDQAGIQLPPKTIIQHNLEVDVEAYPNQARVRQQMKEFATIILDEAKGKALAAPVVIAMYTRLRQIETWPAGIVQYEMVPSDDGKGRTYMRDSEGNKIIKLQVEVHESQKIDYVINDNEGEWNGLIPDAITDERMVLFSQFKAPLEEVARRVNLSGYRAVVLDGDTPEDLRDQIRKDFDARYTPKREDSKWDIVLCNYKVGGVGFNFTAASQLIALDEEWNPGKRDQAYDRIDRIGQIRPTTIHVIRNERTIDDWLAGIMEQKEDIVSGFNNAVAASSLKDFLDDSGLI